MRKTSVKELSEKEVKASAKSGISIKIYVIRNMSFTKTKEDVISFIRDKGKFDL